MADLKHKELWKYSKVEGKGDRVCSFIWERLKSFSLEVLHQAGIKTLSEYSQRGK
jgi:hypothetical protein